MKLLHLAAWLPIALGVVIAAIAAGTWPKWSYETEYLSALLAAEYIGLPAPPRSQIVPPDNLYTGHTVALVVAGALIVFGLIALLFVLHARAVTSAAMQPTAKPV